MLGKGFRPCGTRVELYPKSLCKGGGMLRYKKGTGVANRVVRLYQWLDQGRGFSTQILPFLQQIFNDLEFLWRQGRSYTTRAKFSNFNVKTTDDRGFYRNKLAGKHSPVRNFISLTTL